MQILIVDDSETMRNVLRTALAELGECDVIEAADGAQALEIAKAQSPDLILLDLHMPRMDGIDFVSRFRKADTNTPVVLVTYRHERISVIQALGDNVTDYLIKPFTTPTLSASIYRSSDRAAG